MTVCAAALLWQACGGGGGGGTGGSGGTTPSPLRTNTPRPTGSQPPTQPGQGTPTPPPINATPTLGPDVILVFSGEDIAAAAQNAPSGAVIVVAPGTYNPVLLDPGDLQGPITLLADTSGELTESPAAPVTVIARGSNIAGFEIFGQSELIIDGFSIRGGTDAGILIGDSSGVTVRNCEVTRSGGDAVLMERSDEILVFNNLLTENEGYGVASLGTVGLRAINNTLYKNASGGILLTVDENERASTSGLIQNNIMHQNTPTGLLVDSVSPSSLEGFEGDYNLNTNGYDGPEPGANDIAADPLFILAGSGDFHLAPSSPAVDHATSALDGTLLSALQIRSTQTNGSLDSLPLDMGYHYVAPIPTPTKVPKATRTPIAAATATRTGGTPGGTATPTRTGAVSTPTPTTTPAGRPTRTLRPTRTPRT